MNMCSALLGGIPVAFQEYLPYNGLCWMWQMQVMGEITGLCVVFCFETITNLKFLHWEVESFY